MNQRRVTVLNQYLVQLVARISLVRYKQILKKLFCCQINEKMTVESSRPWDQLTIDSTSLITT